MSFTSSGGATGSNLTSDVDVVSEVSSSGNGGSLPSTTKVVSGYDGVNVRVLATDASGNLQVDVLSGGGIGVTLVDDAVFTPAVSSVTPIGAIADDTGPDSVNEGDVGAIRMSLNRNLYTQIRDAGGSERGLNVDVSGNIGVTDSGGSLTVDNSTLAVVGGGLEGTALRVTLASDTTGLVSVDDNGGSLTVDSGQLPVALVGGRLDVNVGAIGTLTVDTEMAASGVLADGSTAGPSTTIVGAIPFVMNATTVDRQRAVQGGLDTTGTGIAASGLVGQLDDTATSTVTENNFAPVRISTRRALLVEGVLGGTSVPTSVSSVLPGSAALNLGKTEDAAHASGHVGVMSLAVRNDAVGTALVDTDGDYCPIAVTAQGEIFIAGNRAEDAAHVGGDRGIFALFVRNDDSSTSLTSTDADYSGLSVSRFGEVYTQSRPRAGSALAPSLFTDFGVNVTANVKATSGNVFSVSCHNENIVDRYIQLHNTATTPAGGATPLYSFLVSPSQQTIIGTDFFTVNGGNFSTGIAFGFSTTKDIYTAGAAGEQSTIVHYV